MFVARLYHQSPNIDAFSHQIFIDFESLGSHFESSRVPFWEDFGGLGGSWDPLGDTGPPKSKPD